VDSNQIVAFLEALHAKKIKPKGNGWVEACCPLAPWTHEKGHDHTPSFGIVINPGERSFFSCFACKKGSVEELLQTLEMYTQGQAHHFDFKTCRALLDDELKVLPLPEYGSKQEESQVFKEWPAFWLETMPKVWPYKQAVAYLNSRQVTQTEWETHHLLYDEHRNMIVFPYWDVYGRLAGARGRAIVSVEDYPDHHDYTFQGVKNARFVFYNEQALDLKGPVVVVEGQFDCLRVEKGFKKVVANLTAKPTLEKLKKLADSPLVIQIPDKDKAGEESVAVYAQYCKAKGIPYKTLHLGEGVKDPGDCHPDYLRERIEELL
jgi:DNA primase